MNLNEYGIRVSRVWPILLSGILAIVSQPVRAQGDSGFLRGQGKLDLALTYAVDTYDRFWIGSDTVDDAPFGRVSRQTANIYGAYGLSDDMDLAFSASFVYVSTDEVFDSEKALQDFYAQLKWRVLAKGLESGRLNLLVAPAVKIPLTHYEDNAVPAVGDGQVDLRFRTILQFVFNSGSFLALETGYDFRLDEPPNEVPVHLTGGFTLIQRLTIAGFYSFTKSLGGYNIGEGDFPGVKEEYDRLGLNLYCRLDDRHGITFSAWTTLDGMNTGDVDGAALGIVLRY